MNRPLAASALLFLAAPGFALSRPAAAEDPALIERVGSPLRDELLDRLAAWRPILFLDGSPEDAVVRKYGERWNALEKRVGGELHPGALARSRYEFQELLDDALRERHKTVKAAGRRGGYGEFKTAMSEIAEREARYRSSARAAGERARAVASVPIGEIPSSGLVIADLLPPAAVEPPPARLPLPSRSLSLTLSRAIALGPSAVTRVEPPAPGADSPEFYLDVPAGAARYAAARGYLLSRGAQAEVVDATISQALKKGIDPLIPLAVCMQESGCSTVERDRKTGELVPVTSAAGAVGPFQIMPDMHGATAEELRHTPTNVSKGIGLLVYLERKFKDFELMLAGYNAGEGAVRKAGGIPEYGETQDFVKKVSANLETLRRRVFGGGQDR